MVAARGNHVLRSLDRTLGPAALRLLGLLPKRSLVSAVRRVGFLRTAAIGDTLLLAGVLSDTATQLDAEVVLITGGNNAEAGALLANGRVRHVVIPERNFLQAARMIRRLRLDVLVDTGAWPRIDALLTAVSGARFRVGFSTPGQHRHYAYDRTVGHEWVHEADNFRSLVRAIGVNSLTEPALGGTTLPDISVPLPAFFTFHPWSGGFQGHHKEWPARSWIELGRRLAGMYGAGVVITGTAGQQRSAKGLVDGLRQAGVEAASLAGQVTLSEVAALLRRSIGVVSVNTGIMHLSAELGVATVSLEGPTPPERWGPRGPRVRSVRSSFPGCGFLNLGFEYDGHREDCMEGITVDAVESAIRELIGAAAPASART